MKEWSKVRISDEDFIKGIYEKAERYQESEEYKSNRNEPNNNRKWSIKNISTIGSLVVASCAVFTVSTLKFSSMWNKGDNQAPSQQTKIRMVEDNDSKSFVKPASEDANDITVTGTIEGIEEEKENSYFLLNVNDDNQTESRKQIKVVISKELLHRIFEKKSESELTGAQVYLTLLKNKDSSDYSLSDEKKLYIEDIERNGASVYKNIDGDIMEK